MPPERRGAAQDPQAKRQLAEQLAELKALAQEARRQKIDQTPEAKAQMAMRDDQLIAGTAVSADLQGNQTVSRRLASLLRRAQERVGNRDGAPHFDPHERLAGGAEETGRRI